MVKWKELHPMEKIGYSIATGFLVGAAALAYTGISDLKASARMPILQKYNLLDKKVSQGHTGSYFIDMERNHPEQLVQLRADYDTLIFLREEPSIKAALEERAQLQNKSLDISFTGMALAFLSLPAMLVGNFGNNRRKAKARSDEVQKAWDQRLAQANQQE